MKIFLMLFLFVSLTSCFSDNSNSREDNNLKKNITFEYYSDKSVESLEVPPDLTSPTYQSAFKIENLHSNLNLNTVSLSDKKIEKNNETILISSPDINIQRDGARRWLVINKDPLVVWDLVKDFFKEQGFILETENKKTGIIQTNFLENRPRPKIPKSALNIIKQTLQEFGRSYSLAVLDSYRVRIEPFENNTKVEVHLTLNQLKEVISEKIGNIDRTLYEQAIKDESVEIEMLYTLMTHLGGDQAKAREKILSAKDKSDKPIFTLQDSINGYAKLGVNLNPNEVFNNISWALDQMRVDVYDKDNLEKTFYINEAKTSDKGIISDLFGEEALKKKYQIAIKQISKDLTEVYFHDVSEINEKDTKEFSYEFFTKLSNLLK